MPTYEYACKSCGRHVEVVQSFKDDPLTTCAVCGGKLRKVFGSIGITFKGSGFYRTDSRAAGRAKASGEAKEATGTTGSSDSASSEPKGSSQAARTGS